MDFIGSERIDLKLTLLDSAQCFSWIEADGRYFNVLDGQAVCLEAREDGIWGEGLEPEKLRRYLDMDRDYQAIRDQYRSIPQAARAFELYPGLHVLNENVWDALLWGILSANNNTARIRGTTLKLAEALGEKKEIGGQVLFSSPTPERLAGAREEFLRTLGTGYRAPYLIRTAGMVAEGMDLQSLAGLEYEEARKRLLALPGVGDKVANCILLFGLGFSSAFPVDTWVEKLMGSWFGIHDIPRTGMREEARKLLGENAGILQQFLFHAARTGAITL